MKTSALLLCLIISTISRGQAPARHAETPILLSGTHGKFDFIEVDVARRRLLACHTGNGTLDVIDLDSAKLLACVPTGAAQGVAVDKDHGRYFVSVSRPPQLVVIDANKLTAEGIAPLPAPPDLVAYEPQSNRVMVDSSTTGEMWIVEPESRRVVQTNHFPGAQLEDFCFDKWGTAILQNLKNSNAVAKSDFIEDKVPEKWPTLPAVGPHGLALVNGGDALLVAGSNGKAVLMSLKENDAGKVLDSVEVAPKVDEIAYDPAGNFAYAASGQGQISIISVGADDLLSLGTIQSAAGAHSIAVDGKTHSIWIAFVRGKQAFVQCFTVPRR